MAASVGRIWNQGMMSSLRMNWATPKNIFAFLDAEFHFTLDVCATPETATTEEFFSEGALDRPWVATETGSVFANPPYGKALGLWVEKGYRDSCKYYQTIVMLLPARTDCRWFHAYCLNERTEIRFLKGRLKFDDRPFKVGRAPFPSMIAIFRPGRLVPEGNK